MKNSVKASLQSGRASVGSWIQFGHSGIAELMAQAGFDWLVIDLEHSTIGIETAFSLIQVAVKRLEGRQQVRLLEEVNTTMKLIRYEADRFCLQLTDIREAELPPMIGLTEYAGNLARRRPSGVGG